MINNGDGQHPALDTITRITPNRGQARNSEPAYDRIDMCIVERSLSVAQG